MLRSVASAVPAKSGAEAACHRRAKGEPEEHKSARGGRCANSKPGRRLHQRAWGEGCLPRRRLERRTGSIVALRLTPAHQLTLLLARGPKPGQTRHRSHPLPTATGRSLAHPGHRQPPYPLMKYTSSYPWSFNSCRLGLSSWKALHIRSASETGSLFVRRHLARTAAQGKSNTIHILP